jgi:hypothetical protein
VTPFWLAWGSAFYMTKDTCRDGLSSPESGDSGFAVYDAESNWICIQDDDRS